MKYEKSDLDTAARTLYGEIRGGDIIQKQGVAWVIRNRAEHPRWWGHTIVEICLRFDPKTKIHQFSCWNYGDVNRNKLLNVEIRDPIFKLCLDVMRDVLDDKIKDPTTSCDHYCHHSSRPYWARKTEPVYQDGMHNFYRLELKGANERHDNDDNRNTEGGGIVP